MFTKLKSIFNFYYKTYILENDQNLFYVKFINSCTDLYLNIRNKLLVFLQTNRNAIKIEKFLNPESNFKIWVYFLVVALFLYTVLILNYTLKFESTLLIFFFLIFIFLIYTNVYNFILTYLDKLSLDFYINFKEHIRFKATKVRLNVNFLKGRRKQKLTTRKNFKKILHLLVNSFILYKNTTILLWVFFKYLTLESLILRQEKLC